MNNQNGGPEIEQLIQLLARLPGLGPRSARRAVLHLIKKKETLMTPLASALDRAVDTGAKAARRSEVKCQSGFGHDRPF